MKSNCLLFIYCLVLVLGCSSNEEMEPPLNLENRNVLISEILTVEQEGETPKLKEEYDNFRRDLSTYFAERSANAELGPGNVVVSSALGSMYVFNTEEGGYLFVLTDPEDSKIHLMSNERARFSINTNSPMSYITDAEFNRLYSNECHDNRLGSFSTNVVAGFRTRNYEFGTAYFPTGAYESADVLHLNTKVDNGLVEFGNNNEIINCGEPTESKSVTVKLLKRSHTNRLQSPKITVLIK